MSKDGYILGPYSISPKEMALDDEVLEFANASASVDTLCHAGALCNVNGHQVVVSSYRTFSTGLPAGAESHLAGEAIELQLDNDFSLGNKTRRFLRYDERSNIHDHRPRTGDQFCSHRQSCEDRRSGMPLFSGAHLRSPSDCCVLRDMPSSRPSPTKCMILQADIGSRQLSQSLERIRVNFLVRT